MKLARIIAPFSLSAVLFVLSYLSVKDMDEGFYSILLLIIGIALAIVGSTAVFSDKGTLFEADPLYLWFKSSLYQKLRLLDNTVR